jgi:hypothetical protein
MDIDGGSAPAGTDASAVRDTPVTVRFTSAPTVGDIYWQSVAVMRRSAFSLAVGTFMTATSLVAIVLGDRSSVVVLLVGLSLLSGLFAAPFVWWTIRQRRDLVLSPVTVEADSAGLSLTSVQATTQLRWPVFRRARETKRAFQLDTGAGAVVVVHKRGVAEADIGAFRGLLTVNGLIRGPNPRTRLRPLVGVAVGLIGAVVLIGGVVGFAELTRPAATVQLESVPSVEGRHISIDGTTDLPDGTFLRVQVFQLDEWRRALAAQGAQAGDTFEWIESREAIVHGGRFHAEADMTGWPAGRGMSAVYFSIDRGQPAAVQQRFGLDGSGLQGPDVHLDDDTGPTLRIDRGFDIGE